MFQKKIEVPKCTHKWSLVAKNYAPAVENYTPNPSLTNSLNEKALLGFTTYVWECEVCHEILTREIMGSDENRWRDILNRVKRDGIQYIEEDGKTYAVTEWINDERIKINA